MGLKHEYYTLKEAADKLSYSINSVRNLCKKGKIAAVLRNKTWFVSKEGIADLLCPNEALVDREFNHNLDIG
jgi:hypothetical protein